MSANYTQLVDMYKQLDQMKKSDEFMISALKELASRVLRATTKATPALTGNLRRNWKVGSVKKVGSTYQIEIYNNVEYAQYVEYGHRTRNHRGWVPGKFMLTLSENMVMKQSDAIIKKKLEKFIREHLND